MNPQSPFNFHSSLDHAHIRFFFQRRRSVKKREMEATQTHVLEHEVSLRSRIWSEAQMRMAWNEGMAEDQTLWRVGNSTSVDERKYLVF